MSKFLVDLGVIAILFAGISQFRTPRGARAGNLIAAFALLAALVVVLCRHSIMDIPLIVAAVVAGGAIGCVAAIRVTMIGIPAMVAFQHGAGGIAAVLVSAVELTRMATPALPPSGTVSAILGLIIGAGTFSGSMIAGLKLANRIRQTPTCLPGHNHVLLAVTGGIAMLAVVTCLADDHNTLVAMAALLILTSIALGALMAIRIGGADMPVLISFLNATAGLAAALCGVAIGNRLLIACGAAVAASGSILTHVMCRAMNRGLTTVFAGIQPPKAGLVKPSPETQPANIPRPPEKTSESQGAPPPTPQVETAEPFQCAAELLRKSSNIIIVPGYGMALADAQSEVVKLAEQLLEMGKSVLFAVHPVAGRMPGHIHVLLAEAEVDYGLIRELKDINPNFSKTDVVLIVGACDVVNPAAIETVGTPISGMPILNAHEAKHVIVCNLDGRPGYSGVVNPLYHDSKTTLLFGDAKETITHLLALLTASDKSSL